MLPILLQKLKKGREINCSRSFINYSLSTAFDIIYNIPTYTKEQLCQIFINQAKQDGFTVNDDAISKIQTMISTNTSVRLMLNYYNNAKKKHMSNFTEENKYIISAEDIEMPVIRLSIRK